MIFHDFKDSQNVKNKSGILKIKRENRECRNFCICYETRANATQPKKIEKLQCNNQKTAIVDFS